MSINVYVEGGGNGKLRPECRKGFLAFFEKGGLQGKMPKVVACGSRRDAYKRFKIALKSGESALLLVDSESAIQKGISPWQHLKEKDKWDVPLGAMDDQCHFMVQIMESWFLTDEETLIKYYGREFHTKALPKNTNIENISKQDVLKGLKRATKNTQKGKYDKGAHSFEILAQIDPNKVQQASPYAKHLITTLKNIP